MYRVRYGRKQWRTRWPWRWLFPLTVDDRFCRTCGLAFHNGPMPREVKQFTAGNVGAVVYPGGNFGRGSLSVKFGRWKSGSRELYLSEFIAADELDDLLFVAAQARRYIAERSRTRVARR